MCSVYLPVEATYLPLFVFAIKPIENCKLCNKDTFIFLYLLEENAWSYVNNTVCMFREIKVFIDYMVIVSIHS